jgi:hypothetical protein
LIPKNFRIEFLARRRQLIALLDSFAAAHALASSDGRCRCHTLLAEAGRSATHEALPP